MCLQHRFSLILPPSTYIYGAVFILFAIVAALANVTALYILMTSSSTNSGIGKSNKILMSLAVSDALTGIVGFPTSTFQILSESKNSCDLDNIRSVISLILTGSSNLTLALIAFDRYLLMTKFTRYNNLMNDRVLLSLISICWLYPILTIALRYIPSTYPYLASLIFIFYGPILFIIVFYFLLVREIYRSAENIKKHGNRHIVRASSSIGGKTSTEARSAIQSKRSEKRHLRTARAVSWLLACYCLCMAPFNLWLVFSILNASYSFMGLDNLQSWYIFAITVAGWNSCFNPFVYLSKQPNARKRLRQIFCERRLGQVGPGGRARNETINTDSRH